jgi:hypothetical protein
LVYTIVRRSRVSDCRLAWPAVLCAAGVVMIVACFPGMPGAGAWFGVVSGRVLVRVLLMGSG